MNNAITIKLSRDINGNSCISAKLDEYKGIRRQRILSRSIYEDIESIVAELCIKNNLIVPVGSEIYRINDQKFVSVNPIDFLKVFNK